jgi:copper resistance protein C
VRADNNAAVTVGSRRVRRTRAVVRLLLGALAALGAFASALPAAQAHAELPLTSPSENAVLASPPTTVRLTFNEDLLADFAMLTVGVAKAAPRAVRPAVDGRTLTAALPASKSAGLWVVTYRIVSVDGHVMSGTVRFTVRAAAAATSTTGSTAVPQPDPSPTEPTGTVPPSGAGVDLRAAPVTGQAPFAAEDSGSATGLGWWVASVLCLASSAVLAARGRKRTDGQGG